MLATLMLHTCILFARFKNIQKREFVVTFYLCSLSSFGFCTLNFKSISVKLLNLIFNWIELNWSEVKWKRCWMLERSFEMWLNWVTQFMIMKRSNNRCYGFGWTKLRNIVWLQSNNKQPASVIIFVSIIIILLVARQLASLHVNFVHAFIVTSSRTKTKTISQLKQCLSYSPLCNAAISSNSSIFFFFCFFCIPEHHTRTHMQTLYWRQEHVTINIFQG